MWLTVAVTGDGTGGVYALFLTGSSGIAEAFVSVSAPANTTTVSSWVTDTDHSDLQQFPQSFPIGVPVQLHLALTNPNGDGHVSVGALNGTILVQELPG